MVVQAWQCIYSGNAGHRNHQLASKSFFATLSRDFSSPSRVNFRPPYLTLRSPYHCLVYTLHLCKNTFCRLLLYRSIRYVVEVTVHQSTCRPHFPLNAIETNPKMVQECTPDVTSLRLQHLANTLAFHETVYNTPKSTNSF